MPTASILTIGDEILLGHIVDTNAQFISKTLSDIGIAVVARLTVGDTKVDMESGLDFTLKRSDVVIITGGLGPTKDDLTKKVLADWFDSPMETSPEALAHLETLLRRRGREMNPLTRTQADQPIKSEYIHNQVGTAPGMWFFEGGKICISLPGVPYEMKQMLVDEILPRLKSRLQLEPMVHQFIRTVGIAESSLAERIADWETQLPSEIKLAYLPSGGQVKLRMTGRGKPEQELKLILQEELKKAMTSIEDVVFSTEDIEIEEIASDLLKKVNGNLVIEDEVSEGALKARLYKAEGMQSRIHTSIPNHMDSASYWFKLKITSTGNIEKTFDQLIEVEMHKMSSGERVISVVKKEMKSFPQAQVNQNMLSLWAIDLLRRMILQEDLSKSKEKTI